MNNKTLLLIIILIFTTFFLNGKVVIKDVEYLKGDDFVQLHFKTNSILPIPDLFYPIEDNFKFIVMRIDNVSFVGDTKKYSFNSPVIREIDIKPQDKNVDVEILLREKVNYRVFTNRNGLYIEFPVVKSLAGNKGISRPKIIKKVKRTTPEKKNIRFGKNGFIKDVKMDGRVGDIVKFGIELSNPVKFKVIPIENNPARLAIDLPNVRSKKIRKNFNLLNVKGVRGSYNSPNVFRIVFDLRYLKKYNVSYRGNVLEVEFSNKEIPKLKNSENEKLAKTVSKKIETFSPPSKEEQKIAKVKEEPLKTDNKIVEISSAPPAVIEDLKPERKIKLNSKPDFFTEEKSKAVNKDFKNFISVEDDQGNKQISYLKNTIEEGKEEYTGAPMDFSFKNADLQNVLKFIAQVSNLNVVIDPGVTGRISTELKQVPWDQALELFLKINKLDMVLEGTILRIGKVTALAKEAEDRRKLQEARQMDGKLEVTTRKLSYADAGAVKSILSKQLSKRGEIIVDKRTNILIISEIAENMEIIDKLIDTLDASNPQVAIEAKIVETSTKYTRNLGIQWGTNFAADSFHGNQTNLQFPNSVNVSGDQMVNTLNPGIPSSMPGGGYAVNVPASGAPTAGVSFSFGNVANTFQLSMALTAMENSGNGKIISSPKITTQDNLKAKIVQGARIPVQTTQNNTISIRYENAALELEVTPHITAKGTIVMKVKIKNDYPDWGNTVSGGTPQIITQELENTVMANDGGTIVIGGIFKVEDSHSSDKVPFISKIPILGSLFKNSNKRREQKELLVFISPRIIK
ncbi:MAG: type IV pilus secretin PilQ [Acidobacteriota bacterium]